uniref:Uncharacterized protein n=1 Tax=Macaca mulatta TaxID=9544 RepID=A0A5F8ASA6_MACMU
MDAAEEAPMGPTTLDPSLLPGGPLVSFVVWAEAITWIPPWERTSDVGPQPPLQLEIPPQPRGRPAHPTGTPRPRGAVEPSVSACGKWACSPTSQGCCEGRCDTVLKHGLGAPHCALNKCVSCLNK